MCTFLRAWSNFVLQIKLNSSQSKLMKKQLTSMSLPTFQSDVTLPANHRYKTKVKFNCEQKSGTYNLNSHKLSIKSSKCFLSKNKVCFCCDITTIVTNGGDRICKRSCSTTTEIYQISDWNHLIQCLVYWYGQKLYSRFVHHTEYY